MFSWIYEMFVLSFTQFKLLFFKYFKNFVSMRIAQIAFLHFSEILDKNGLKKKDFLSMNEVIPRFALLSVLNLL